MAIKNCLLSIFLVSVMVSATSFASSGLSTGSVEAVGSEVADTVDKRIQDIMGSARVPTSTPVSTISIAENSIEPESVRYPNGISGAHDGSDFSTRSGNKVEFGRSRDIVGLNYKDGEIRIGSGSKTSTNQPTLEVLDSHNAIGGQSSGAELNAKARALRTLMAMYQPLLTSIFESEGYMSAKEYAAISQTLHNMQELTDSIIEK